MKIHRDPWQEDGKINNMSQPHYETHKSHEIRAQQGPGIESLPIRVGSGR